MLNPLEIGEEFSTHFLTASSENFVRLKVLFTQEIPPIGQAIKERGTV